MGYRDYANLLFISMFYLNSQVATTTYLKRTEQQFIKIVSINFV